MRALVTIRSAGWTGACAQTTAAGASAAAARKRSLIICELGFLGILAGNPGPDQDRAADGRSARPVVFGGNADRARVQLHSLDIDRRYVVEIESRHHDSVEEELGR